VKNFRTRSAMIAVVAAAAVGVSASPALAATDATNVTVTGGVLSITNPVVANFTGVTLNGAAQTTTAAVDAFSVNDATGTGGGWNVTVQASQLAQYDSTLNAGAGGYVTGGRTLALNSLSLPASTVASPNTTSPDPSITAGPYLIDSASAVKVASAAANEGMGKYDFSAATLTLSLPASVYAANYRSDVTLSVVTGP
jgi:hypothetical protein